MYDENKLRSYTTKSDKIRYLAHCGLTTGSIAKKLGIRYQHARNVLLTPLKREMHFEPLYNKEQEQAMINEYGR